MTILQTSPPLTPAEFQLLTSAIADGVGGFDDPGAADCYAFHMELKARKALGSILKSKLAPPAEGEEQ